VGQLDSESTVRPSRRDDCEDRPLRARPLAASVISLGVYVAHYRFAKE
jgi:hypothetical protein